MVLNRRNHPLVQWQNFCPHQVGLGFGFPRKIEGHRVEIGQYHYNFLQQNKQLTKDINWSTCACCPIAVKSLSTMLSLYTFDELNYSAKQQIQSGSEIMNNQNTLIFIETSNRHWKSLIQSWSHNIQQAVLFCF